MTPAGWHVRSTVVWSLHVLLVLAVAILLRVHLTIGVLAVAAAGVLADRVTTPWLLGQPPRRTP